MTKAFLFYGIFLTFILVYFNWNKKTIIDFDGFLSSDGYYGGYYGGGGGFHK